MSSSISEHDFYTAIRTGVHARDALSEFIQSRLDNEDVDAHKAAGIPAAVAQFAEGANLLDLDRAHACAYFGLLGYWSLFRTNEDLCWVPTRYVGWAQFGYTMGAAALKKPEVMTLSREPLRYEYAGVQPDDPILAPFMPKDRSTPFDVGVARDLTLFSGTTAAVLVPALILYASNNGGLVADSIEGEPWLRALACQTYGYETIRNDLRFTDLLAEWHPEYRPWLCAVQGLGITLEDMVALLPEHGVPGADVVQNAIVLPPEL